MKSKFKFKYSKSKFSHGINRICVGKKPYDTSKSILTSSWRVIYDVFYSKYGQYGKVTEDGELGVLTPKRTWSAINQFNTHTDIQDIIVQFLNQNISNDFFSKGIDEVDGRKVKLIDFDPKNEDVESINLELKNYFNWLYYYGDKLFKDLGKLSKDDILHHLLEIATFTMAAGTFGELAVEYFIRTQYPDKYDVLRNSSLRGNSDDMKNGVDLYTIEKNNSDVKKKFQIKNARVYDNNVIYKSINTSYYHDKGIDYLVLVQMNIDESSHLPNPTSMIFFKMLPNLFETTKSRTGKYYYSYKKEDIIMEEQISPIFKSKIFFEFFMYCSKHGIEFNMDVLDDTTIQVGDKSVHVTLPKNHEHFNESIIIESWEKLINQFEDGTPRKESLEYLKELVKK